MQIQYLYNDDGSFIKISDLLCWLTAYQLDIQKDCEDENEKHILLELLDIIYKRFDEVRDQIESGNYAEKIGGYDD